ncbi:FHA domain-containing protein At4g14490-like [Bidens hawaiensis]|uniref:FHA domain-containing protein At4g14490-like n=1 Tax=Bidens hawaiensis TaxID=980011 RepID=UPI00404B3A16
MDLKLIIEKGPREGETLTYSSDSSSSSLIKVGRVIRNQGIWYLIQTHVHPMDLNSSNGTFLNTQKLHPHVPSVINNGDRIKIGELTSIVVMIEFQSSIAAAVGEEENNELGDLGKVEPVKKRNLQSNVKKGVDARNEVETASSRRTLRSSKKDEVSLVSALNQIPENLNVDVSEMVNVSVPVEAKVTRGRKKKIPDLDQTKPADVVVVEPVRTTRGRKKALPVETLEDNLNNVNECLQVGDGIEATIGESLSADVSEMVNVSVPVEPKMTRGRKKKMPEQLPDLDQTKPANVVVVPARTTRGRKKALPVETLEDNLNNVTECLQVGDGIEDTLGENLESNNEPVEEQLEKMVSTQEGCEGSSKGKKEDMKYGCYNEKWNDLEKMTVDDFFDYLEWQFAKEIYEKSEKIIADMTEKARKYHEFRRQINESGKGKN